MSELQSATWILSAVVLTLLLVGAVEWRNRIRGLPASLLWALIWFVSIAAVAVATVLGAGASFGIRIAAPIVAIVLAFSIGLWAYRRRRVKTADEPSPLEHADQLLLERILSLRSTTVGDIMSPIDRMNYAVGSSSIKDAIELVRKTKQSRIPLLEEESKRPLGFLHSKDLVPFIHQESPEGRIGDLRREVLTVPVQEHASRLLESFRQQRIHMAIVTDAGGKTLGLVTLGDFYKHLLGERVPVEST